MISMFYIEKLRQSFISSTRAYVCFSTANYKCLRTDKL